MKTVGREISSMLHGGVGWIVRLRKLEALISIESQHRPSILFTSWIQFGYHTDSHKYCRYLRNRYRLTYLSADQGLPRKHLPGVEVVYCGPPIGGSVEIRLAVDTCRLLHDRRFALAFIQRSKVGFLIRALFPMIPVVFDIRSGSIEASAIQRALQNGYVRWNAHVFKHVTVISSGLAQQLRLPKRAHVLPLGADKPVLLTTAGRSEIRLIYIGTFENRNIERTVDGLGIFANQNQEAVPFSYTVVGFGTERDRARIEEAIRRHGLESRVRLHGRVDHDRVPELLCRHNVGVGFTPKAPWFEHQPSTKVFEYLQSGLLCLATDSAANREVVNSANGVLIDDNPQDFARGLQDIANMLASWRPQDVADSVRHHTWESVVTTNLIPFLEDAMGRGRST